MSRPFRSIAAASMGLAAVFYIVGRPASATPEPTPAKVERESQPSDLILTADQAIAELQQRLAREPSNAANYVLLGQMYVRKARETGDVANYDRADAALRRALQLDPANAGGQATLAQVFSANHRFAEGLALAERVYREHPDKPHVLMLIGDAQLELGRYAEAERAYDELRRRDPLARLASRDAHLAELKGRSEEAVQLMARAEEEESRLALSPAAKAWYPSRLGELHLNAGRITDAETHYQRARQLAPRYPAALAGLARLRTVEGRYDEAITLYDQAIQVNPEVRTLASLGDLYLAVGKHALAASLFDMIERLAAGKTTNDRELALFYCDHDRALAKALELAERDLTTRADVYAYDTLAWALYKNRRYEEAGAAMTEALKLGTRDARMYHHAGMIAAARGQSAQARELFERALAIHPAFDLVYAAEAKRMMAELPPIGG